MLSIILLFQERANFPPAAFSRFPYPSFHLVSLILSPLHIPEVPVVVLFPNLQNLLKETNEKEKILSEFTMLVLTTRSSIIPCGSPSHGNF